MKKMEIRFAKVLLFIEAHEKYFRGNLYKWRLQFVYNWIQGYVSRCSELITNINQILSFIHFQWNTWYPKKLYIYFAHSVRKSYFMLRDFSSILMGWGANKVNWIVFNIFICTVEVDSLFLLENENWSRNIQ